MKNVILIKVKIYSTMKNVILIKVKIFFGLYHEKIQLDQIQNGRLAAMILICVITGKTVPDCLTTTIEQNVRFQVEIYREICQLDQIRDGRPVATFDFNIFKNWKIVPDR